MDRRVSTTTDSEGRRHTKPIGLALGWGAFWFAAGLLAMVAVFWPGLTSLVIAWQLPEYSHGPLIPCISAYLFLRQMRMTPDASGVPVRWPGVLVIAAALMVGIMGNLVRIPDLVTYALIVWTGGLVLVVLGVARGWKYWPPVLHLIFMLPLPQFVYWKLSIFLQAISSQLGVALISAVGIPVYLDGNIIDLGIYQLQVAEACSGLRYLFPVMSFSYIFAVLYTGPIWHKAVLLLSAAPITVLMNSFRIGVIGVLVDQYGIGQAEGFLHLFEGWIIFIACVAILCGEAMILQRLTRNPQPLSQALDIDFSGIGPQLRRAREIVPSTSLIVAVLLTAGVAGLWYGVPEPAPAAIARQDLVTFPRTLVGWTGQSQRLDRATERVLGADDYYSASYQSANEAASVDLFIAYYDKLTEGSGIHSPEVCLPTGGWEVSRWQQVDVTLPEGGASRVAGATVHANRAIITKGTSRQLVFYWFQQRQERLTSDYAAKLNTIWDSATIGRSDGALVRLVTAIGPKETEAEATARIARFMLLSLDALPRFVPE